jgi:hypothetical protein
MNSLRGHHLICLHFFKGEGYDAAFVKNLRSVIAKAAREGVRVKKGVDDVCLACPHLRAGKCSYKKGEATIRRLDALALELLDIRAGSRVDWLALKNRLPRIFPEWRRKACVECDWLSVCMSTELWKSLEV